MNSLKSFVFAMGACIGLPTYLVAIRPYAVERARQPVAYTPKDPSSPDSKGDDDAYKGLIYPASPAGSGKRGELVYAREGCAQCHTQVVRPDFVAIDRFKKYGGREQAYAKDQLVMVRQTHPWDYMNEDFAMIGLRRVGPDLANAGYRFEGSKIQRFYQHLYAPRSIHGWSNSPSYKHLFEVKEKESPVGRPDALALPANLLPEDSSLEIIPSEDAVALGQYIQSLKRAEPLPIKISGEGAEAPPVAAAPPATK